MLCTIATLTASFSQIKQWGGQYEKNKAVFPLEHMEPLINWSVAFKIFS